MKVGIRRQQGRGSKGRIRTVCPRCSRYYLRAIYAKDRPARAKTAWRKIGLYCDGCQHFRPIVTLDEVLSRYPALEQLKAELKPHWKKVAGLYLHGSRVRGPCREDSDYDVLLITSGEINSELKNKLKIYNIELVNFTIDQVEQQLEQSPSFIITALREGVPIAGAELREELLEKFVNSTALLKELKYCKMQLKHLKKRLRHILDSEEKRRILHLAFIRLRQAHAVKKLFNGKEPLQEDFKKYYKNSNFESLYQLYVKVRTLPWEADMDESQIPEEIKKLSKTTLIELTGAIDCYLSDVYRELRAKVLLSPKKNHTK